MVSIEQTSKKYRGKKAATYEAVRKKQIRWAEENRIVEQMLVSVCHSAILDVPVGTGRFLPLYAKLGSRVTGVDASEDMLKLARKTAKKFDPPMLKLEIGDAVELDFHAKDFDVVVCVRFLDLIDEAAMRKVVAELCRVSMSTIICTIRFGEKYLPKSNTAEHDRRKFLALVKKLGWRVDQEVPIFRAGWTVLKLRRAR